MEWLYIIKCVYCIVKSLHIAPITDKVVWHFVKS